MRLRHALHIDEELDLVAVGIVHVHPFAEAVVELEQDHDAGRFDSRLTASNSSSESPT